MHGVHALSMLASHMTSMPHSPSCAGVSVCFFAGLASPFAAASVEESVFFGSSLKSAEPPFVSEVAKILPMNRYQTVVLGIVKFGCAFAADSPIRDRWKWTIQKEFKCVAISLCLENVVDMVFVWQVAKRLILSAPPGEINDVISGGILIKFWQLFVIANPYPFV